MLDEKTHRKEGFREDLVSWVTLSDGQMWGLAKPYLTLTPVFLDGDPQRITRFYSYGPPLAEALELISQAEGLEVTILCVVALAAMLLRQSYDLSDEELAAILCYRVNDDASDELLRNVIDIATGNLFAYEGRGVLDDPKPQSVGSAPA